jgi:2-polyprenyl-3-methyl-5-hydroxy-6-metoxy-1,4-benzoquinol methylase
VNEFLKTKNQILASTQWLKENGYVTHPISCKDWELAMMTESLIDGDILDMGADGSFILHNSVIKGVKGRKVGVDLIEVTGNNKSDGVEYYQCDLMNTGLEDNSFDIIFSASVIEHQVNFSKFAKEVGRLLRLNGNIFVSFDTWTPKPDTSKMKLYSLSWDILDRNDIQHLVNEFSNNGIELTSDIDWTTQDAVINRYYCAPADVEYTFGILNFVKK